MRFECHAYLMHNFRFLTHSGQVTHICVCKLTIIDSDNGLSPERHQAIIWTNARFLLIRPLETNFSEILIEIYIFLLKKKAFENGVWKMASILSQPQCVNSMSPVGAHIRCWTGSSGRSAANHNRTNGNILSIKPAGNFSKTWNKTQTCWIPDSHENC